MNKSLGFMALLLLGVVGNAFAVQAADYPSDTVRIIVPYPPGGGTDRSTRILAEALSDRVGQPVVVENRPGATGSIGTDYVVESSPDGYTLLVSSTDSITIVPALNPNAPYKPQDLSYVSKFASTGMALVVSANLPVTSVDEFVAYAEAHPDEIQYGTTGVEGLPHLAMLLLEKYAGVSMTAVNYKGVAPMLTDLLGAHIDAGLVTPVTLVPYLDSLDQFGIQVVAYTGSSRHPLLPDVPTMTEAGIPEATATVWYGLFGPANLPLQVLERLRGEVAAIVDTADFRKTMAVSGLLPATGSGEDFEKSAVAEYEQWGELVAEEDITVQQ